MRSNTIFASSTALYASLGFSVSCMTTHDPSAEVLSATLQQDQAATGETGLAPTSGACEPTECATVTPNDALIADFNDVSPAGVFVDSDSYANRKDSWWLEFYGSPYVYPSGSEALTQSTNAQWRVRGTVADWSGFGLWFGACTVDLSRFEGFTFDVSGTAGPSRSLQLFVNTAPNTPPEVCRTNVGTCAGAPGECRQASTQIELLDGGASTVTIRFAELAGGQPEVGVDPAQVLQFHFAFSWFDYNGEKAEAYEVDLALDNFRLFE